jgi:RNA polymerase sigma factor for flagellar operon FliA
MQTMQALSERNRLISEHTQIATRIALKMAKRIPEWVERDDIVAASMIGLVEAADRYDATREESFLTFAEFRIRGAVLDELRRGDMVPRRARQLARKIAAAVRKLEQAEGAAPDEAHVAGELGVSVEDYRVGLEKTVFEIAPLDDDAPIEDPQSMPVDAQVDQSQTLRRVQAAFRLLGARDMKILALHFLDEMTFAEIARVIGITPSRVCQLMWRAIGQLRQELGAGAPLEAAS